MSILCKIITDILHITEIVIVCKYYLKLREKIKDKYRYIKVIIISVFVSLVMNVIDNETIALIIYLLCVGIIMQICYLENCKRIIIGAVWISIIVEIIDILSLSIMNTVGTVMNFHNELFENLIAMVLSVIIIYIVSKLLRRISGNGIRNVSIKYLIAFTAILFVDLMLLTLMLRVTLGEVAYKNKIMYIMVYIFVVAGIFIQLASVILLLVSRNEHREKEQIIKQYLEEQVSHYEYLNEREKETKKFRHDIRGHLYFLYKLKSEGKNEEFETYFQDIIDKVDDLGKRVNVGNDIVNAVLSKACTEAEEKNIKMEITGRFPLECHVSAYHLCTIFFNLLNNAIEATEKTIKREIWVICRYTQKEIIVEIGNYFCNENKLDKTNLRTTKNENDYHGWGMKNVEESVTACKGLMDIDIEEDKFIVSLTLENKKEKEEKAE